MTIVLNGMRQHIVGVQLDRDAAVQFRGGVKGLGILAAQQTGGRAYRTTARLSHMDQGDGSVPEG